SSSASSRSKPEQNALPAPVSTRARMSSSSSIAQASRSNSANIWSVIELKVAGRLSVMTTSPDSTGLRVNVSKSASSTSAVVIAISLRSWVSVEFRASLADERGNPLGGLTVGEQPLFGGLLEGHPFSEREFVGDCHASGSCDHRGQGVPREFVDQGEGRVHRSGVAAALHESNVHCFVHVHFPSGENNVDR